MDSFNFGEVLLKAYNHLKIMAEKIDSKVDFLSRKSSGFFGGQNNFLNICDEISKLIDKKLSLCNIKVKIVATLKKMKLKKAKILALRYVQELGIEEISELVKLSKRGVLYQLNVSLKEFNNEIDKAFSREEREEVMKILPKGNERIYGRKALKVS